MIAKGDEEIFQFLGSKSNAHFFQFPSTVDVLLEYFEIYISTLEEYLEIERTKILEQLESDPEVQSALEEPLFVIENIFPNMMRGSIFVAIYTVLEDGLKMRCDCLKKLRDCPSADNKREKNYLKRYQQCISRLTNIDIEQIDGWQQLVSYGQIRNRIVHNRGTVNRQNTDLIEFISTTPDLNIGDDEEITLKQKACQTFIDIVRQFFESLDRQMPVQCVDLEKHFGFRP